MSFGKKYLKPFTKFPLQEDCQSWGREELFIDCAGGPYHFSGLSVIQAKAIKERFRDQCLQTATNSRRCVKSIIYRIDPANFRHINMEGGWLYESMDYTYQPDNIRLAGIQLLAQLDFGSTLAASMWTPLEEHDWFSGIVFENFFRVLVAYRLLTIGGILLHSSGVVDKDGDKCILFLGPSGAGKSTIADLAHEAGYRIMSDDLNTVIPHDDKLFVEKVPFSGTFAHDFCRGDSYPLHSIYRIIKGEKNHIEQISRAEALSVLLSCAPFVNEDRYRFNLLSDTLEGIIDGVSSFRLSFTLDGGCLDLINEKKT